jgi:glycosyltransferase involved in cell wall biosynthesis
MHIKKPKISIVTPSFNQGVYLEETILSIINQSYSNYELLIVDAGSTDSTLDVIHKYEQYITYWVSEPDRGQSHAIQKGLAKATGDIINWINSDDLLAPGALQEIANKFDTDVYDVFCGRCDYFLDKVGNWDLQGLRMGLSETVGDTLLAGKITQPSTFFKTSIFRELGVHEDFHFTMDLDLWYRYLLKFGQSKVLLSDEVLAYFRLHHSSKTVASSSKFLEDINKVNYNILYSLDLPSKLLEFVGSEIDFDKFYPKKYIISIPLSELNSYVKSHAWYAIYHYNENGDREGARACLKVARKYGHAIDVVMIKQLIKHYILPKNSYKV